jgi:hypothetical protein
MIKEPHRNDRFEVLLEYYQFDRRLSAAIPCKKGQPVASVSNCSRAKKARKLGGKPSNACLQSDVYASD